jgi:integrase
MVVPERREFDRASEKSEDGVVSHALQAKVSYFRNYDLRSTYATRLAAGRCEGIQEILADEAPNEKAVLGSIWAAARFQGLQEVV